MTEMRKMEGVCGALTMVLGLLKLALSSLRRLRLFYSF